MIKKEWKINNTSNTKSLIERLLLVRGIGEDEVNEFLNPYELDLLASNVFVDMEKSVDRIELAINNKEKILIYGDFDADGITSTSVLVKTLTHLGADVDYYIPSREEDGHGLNTSALVKLMSKVKPKLIITVDCGIGNVDEVKFLNSFKKDIIITDHHESGEILPDAYSIINPKAQNSLDEKLSTKDIKYLTSLAGVGVAFKLAQAILDRFGEVAYSEMLLPYVAVGTVADVVPLIGENRYYVLKGLDLISKGRHYGFKRLLEKAGYTNIDDGITSEQIAFGIAPRVNASGRLDTVECAMKVMLSDNKTEVELAVEQLDNFNKQRQELSNIIFKEADELASGEKEDILVLIKKDWHIGIIGIVASKISEKYGKPAFLMTYTDDSPQVRCSARGVEGCDDISLYEIISEISDKLDGFGGHSKAGGLYFSKDKVSFDEVKKGLIESYKNCTNGKNITPTINIDLELSPKDVTENLINDISRLEPFGASNPSPLFVIKDFNLKDKMLMGSTQEHLRLTVEKDGVEFKAIWWSVGDIGLEKGSSLDLAFSPQINTFNGNTTIQLIVRDVHSEDLVMPEVSDVVVYDHRKKTDILDKVNEYLKGTKYDFCVFAENPRIISELKPFAEIYKRIINRTDLVPKDGIMFFDCPAEVELMDDILSEIKPARIHYMGIDIDSEKEFDYLKYLSGMLKYSANSNNGIFDVTRASVHLGISSIMIEQLLELIEEEGGIIIKDNTTDSYKIEYLKPITKDTLSDTKNYFEIIKPHLEAYENYMRIKV